MQLVVLIALSALGSGVGWAYVFRKRRVEKLLCELKDACNIVETQICYRRLSVLRVFQDLCQTASPQLRVILTAYLREIGACDLKQTASACAQCGLSRQETVCIVSFFADLGKSDVTIQRERIKSFRDSVAQFAKERNAQNGRNGPLCVKLGLLAGIALGILLW